LNEQYLTAEHQRLLDNAKEMEREALDHFNKQLKNVLDTRHKMFMNDHWSGIPLEDWQTPFVANYCRQAHHWYLSLLTDTPSKLAVQGYSPDDYEPDKTGMSRVERVYKLVRWKWDDLRMDNRMMNLLSRALIFGHAFLKPYINPFKTWEAPVMTPNGKQYTRMYGDLDVAVLGPDEVLIDPNATWTADPIEVMETAEYVIHRHMVSVRRLKRWYPHLRDRIDALPTVKKEDIAPWRYRTVDTATGTTHDEWLPQANAAGSSANTSGSWIKVPEAPDRFYDTRRVMVSEIYMRDSSAPSGMVCVTKVDEHLLEVRGSGLADDKPYPFAHNKFPFIFFVVNAIPGRAQGFGIFDIIIPVQLAFNKAHAQIFDYMNLFKGPPLIFEEGSIDVKKLAIAPLVKIPYVAQAHPPTWLNLPVLPPEAFRRAAEYKEMMQDLIGVNEAIMAGSIKAGTAGVAVEGMLEQAMQRIRQIERENYAAKAELGYQMLSIMQQLYANTGIELRILGPYGSPQSVFLQPDDLMGKKDLRIISESARVLKKAEEFKKLMDLTAAPPPEQRGVPVPDEVLIDAADVPNPDKLKEEVSAQRNLQEQLMQLQQENEQLKQQLGAAMPAPQGQPPQAGGIE